MKPRRFLTTLWVIILALNLAWAQGPNNTETYYLAANGKSGQALKTAMYNIIKNPSVKNYENLTDYYPQTDKRTDGKVRDRYSNITNYTFSQCTGNYSKEGDMYNKEHSFPKSWFGGKVTPMYSDLFHVIPADGYVNNRRGNVPFGTTNGNVYTSANDYSKVGDCTYSGYTGTVFEPDDEWKGDFARIYFYMVTCYEDKVATWINNATSTDKSVIAVLNGTKYPAFTDWQKSLLLEWSRNDPVSEIEIARNAAVYNIQRNRNPFVDYPGLEEYIWGTKTSESFDYTMGGSGETPTTVSTPTFSPAGGTYTTEQTVTISCATSGATIYYTTDGTTPSAASTKYNAAITISETTTLKAIAIKDDTESSVASATYTINTGGGDEPTPSEIIVWEEDWTGASSSASVESIKNSSAVYQGDGGTNCKIYNEKLAGGTAPELLIPKTSRDINYFIATITLGGASGEMPLSFKCNRAISVTSTTSGVTVTAGGNSDKTYNYVVNVPSGTTTLALKFATTNDQNARIDDIKLVSVAEEPTTTPGDIVKDGKTDWNDLKALVKIMLGITPAGDNIDSDAADVNGDHEPNIADVTKLVNMILQNNQ